MGRREEGTGMKRLIICVSVGGACCMFTCIICFMCMYKCMNYIYVWPFMVDLCPMFCHSIVFSHWMS